MFKLCILSALLFGLFFCTLKISGTSVNQALLDADANAISLYVGPDQNYSTITDAINAVPLSNTNRYIIHVTPGVYREKITIPVSKDFITLMGDDTQKFSTVIVFNGNSANSVSTYNSSTFAVNANYFTAQYITFKNDAPYAYPGGVNTQAVALRVSGDFAAFYDCFITSSQDTLYDHQGRHYYKRVYIQGNIDFIFGRGRSLFEDCHIVSNSRNMTGSITAQGKSQDNQNSGYTFYNSYIGGTGRVVLGRPWRKYAFVTFVKSYLDEVVNPLGWGKWSYNTDDGTVTFGEYQNRGPGSNTENRVKWMKQLTQEEADAYSSISFVEGAKWLNNK